MIPIANFYLGASTPSSSTFNRPVSMSQASLPRSPASPPSNQSKQGPVSYRASMPVPSRIPDTPPSHASAFIGQPSSAKGSRTLEAPGEELEDDPALQTARLENAEKRKSRSGSINKEFRFPPLSRAIASTDSEENGEKAKKDSAEAQEHTSHGKLHGRKPSAIEVPAPPPVEKEPSFSSLSLAESTDDDVGPTVEISLN
jgi:hypothetical protein